MTTARILVAQDDVLRRLALEGGLRTSFATQFRGTLWETADDSNAGDGLGFDDLLRQHQLVSVDIGLLQESDQSSPSFHQRERYRYNFAKKIAGRETFWIVVIDGGDESQAKMVVELGRQLCWLREISGAKGAPPNAVPVLVFTRQITAETREAIRQLTQNADSGVQQVYLMAHRLQPADRGSRAVSAHAVWPVCVARLLAVRCATERPVQGVSKAGNRRAQIKVWRTVQWGGVSPTSSTSNLRALIREELLPTLAIEGEEDAMERERKRPSPSGLVKQDVTSPDSKPYEWNNSWEDIWDRARWSIDDPVFESMLEESGRYSRDARTMTEGLERDKDITRKVEDDWGAVAEDKPQRGVGFLRQLRDGRLWPAPDVGRSYKDQRQRLDGIIDERRKIHVARENHRDAAEELALARSRHLRLLWRFIVAAIVMLLIGQILAGVMVPLRADDVIGDSGGGKMMGVTLDDTVFVLDRSGSMGGERIDSLREHMKLAIGGLKDGQHFGIITFNSGTPDDPSFVHLGPNHTLWESTERTRSDAVKWIEANLQAGGGTDPRQGIGIALSIGEPANVQSTLESGVRVDEPTDPPKEPARLLLLTDGEFADTEEIFQMVSKHNESRKERGVPELSVDTVTVWQRDEQPFLKYLSKETDGEYRHDGFDLFAPLGFFKFMLIVLSATALGVLIGVFLPYTLEVWRGRRAVKKMTVSTGGLLKWIAIVAQETQELLRGANEAFRNYQLKAIASRQQFFARRALAMIESIFAGGPAAAPDGAGKRGGSFGALEGEDRRDLLSCLNCGDIHPSTRSEGEALDEAKSSAIKAATKFRGAWRNFCQKHDKAKRGHLPIAAVCREMGAELDRLCDEASEESNVGLWTSRLSGRREEEVKQAQGEQLASLLDCETIPVCFSARVADPKSGRMPERHLQWVSVNPSAYPPSLSQLVDDVYGRLRERHQPKKFEVTRSGTICLALVHEEIDVDLTDGDDLHDVVVCEGA